MALTRADALTGKKIQREYFSDFTTSFAKTPFGNQLAKVTNEQAVNQSIKNLVRTNLGERLFQPMVGSDVLASLFETKTAEAVGLLELFIENTIRNNEPRVNKLEVFIDLESIDENSVEITLLYNLINNPEEITLTMLLKRVR